MVSFRIRQGAAALALALLAGCSAVSQFAGPDVSGDVSGVVSEVLSGDNTQARGVSEFTATRESLAAQGITAGLIKVTTRQPRVESAGLLKVGETASGVEIFRDQAGSEIFLAGGLLRASTAQEPELAGADTAPLAAALSGTGPASYSRVLRHRDGAGKIFATSLDCRLEATGPETRVILGTAIATTGHLERCTGAADGAGRRIVTENRYWSDGHGVVVASEQWLNHSRGHIAIERIQ